MTAAEFTANWLSNVSVYTLFTFAAALLAVFWTGETKDAKARSAAKKIMAASAALCILFFGAGHLVLWLG